MAILNYTTSIDSMRTIMEIQKILVKNGATKIMTQYENGIESAVTFCLIINGNEIAFSLPANHKGVLNAMNKDRKVARYMCKPEQAQRVAWRIVKDWVEAQMAIIEAGLAETAEVFLPYVITKNGTTLYNSIKENPGMLMLT